MTASQKQPPSAATKDHRISCHGVERNDVYAWLRADNWRELMGSPAALDPSIRHYLEAENSYTEESMRDTAVLQQQLFAEFKGRIEEDWCSVPIADGDYAYYVRYRRNGQYPIYCRYRTDAQEREEILFDANAESAKYDYFAVADFEHSPDHRLVAYCLDTDGSEFYTLYIRDVESGDLFGRPVPRLQGDLVWARDSKHIFYIALDSEHRPREVYRHCPGGADDDALVYRENDAGFFINLAQTRSRRYIVINIHAHDTTECRLIDMQNIFAPPVLMRPRVAGVEYYVEHHRDDLLLRTNIGGAHDYKIMRTPCDSPAAEWRDFHLPSSSVLLEDVMVFKDWIVRCEREHGLPRLTVMDMREGGDAGHTIAFAEECYELGVKENNYYEGDILRFSYVSMTTPEKIYDYDMKTRRRVLRKQQRLPSGHRPDDYSAKRFTVATDDGETVPLSMLYAKATPPAPDSPLLLYAYGAYGCSVPATFSARRLSLLQRGFVFAIAHVRGGMEKGYRWYADGKLQHKQNTFNDFIACARYLIERGFTAPEKLAIHGGSAGGMLIGAVLNMQPQLFAAAIADVPFVDVLTTMSDETLPLTPPEWPEWGNPLCDAQAYHRIAAYSPYDNVTRQAYPNLLVTAGLTDPRVTYWEPAKWVAKLRAMKTDTNLLLLKINMSAGHAGVSGRYDALKEVALQYAFLLKVFALR